MKNILSYETDDSRRRNRFPINLASSCFFLSQTLSLLVWRIARNPDEIVSIIRECSPEEHIYDIIEGMFGQIFLCFEFAVILYVILIVLNFFNFLAWRRTRYAMAEMIITGLLSSLLWQLYAHTYENSMTTGGRDRWNLCCYAMGVSSAFIILFAARRARWRRFRR
jgi:hypothetical protein